MKTSKNKIFAFWVVITVAIVSVATASSFKTANLDNDTVRHLDPASKCLKEQPCKPEACRAQRHRFEVAFRGTHYHLSTPLLTGTSR